MEKNILFRPYKKPEIGRIVIYTILLIITYHFISMHHFGRSWQGSGNPVSVTINCITNSFTMHILDEDNTIGRSLFSPLISSFGILWNNLINRAYFSTTLGKYDIYTYIIPIHVKYGLKLE